MKGLVLAGLFLAGAQVSLADPKSDVLAAFTALDNVPAFRAIIDEKIGTSEFLETFELVRPHRFHFVLKQATQQDEVYLTDGTISLKLGSGWLRVTPSYAPDPAPVDQWMRQIYADKLTQVTQIGPETINGSATIHYQSRFSYHDSNNAADATCDSWIAADTHLPVQLNCSGVNQTRQFQDSTLFEYGSIRIVAP